MIAPIAVTESESIAFIVLLAAPGVPLVDVLALQAEHIGVEFRALVQVPDPDFDMTDTLHDDALFFHGYLPPDPLP